MQELSDRLYSNLKDTLYYLHARFAFSPVLATLKQESRGISGSRRAPFDISNVIALAAIGGQCPEVLR